MSTDIQTINNTMTPAEVVVSGGSALDTLERASIDMQIATAHQFPRSLSKFKERAIGIALLDEESAGSCIYNRPVGKDQYGKQAYASGMSVRMAEIVASCYGNLRVAARIVQQTDRMVVAQGIAHDLETNFLSTSEVIEATVKRNGQPYDERMRIVIAKAALAKARRDAIFQVVPKALAKPVEQAVKDMLVGNARPLVERRKGVVQWINTMGIKPDRVWAALGVQGVDDLTDNHFLTLTGLRTSIKDGDITIDEAFPELETSNGTQTQPKTAVEKATSRLKEKAAKTAKADAEPKQTPQSEMFTVEQIAKYADENCTERGDYLSMQALCGNYVQSGKLPEDQLEAARKAIADVAAKNGIKL